MPKPRLQVVHEVPGRIRARYDAPSANLEVRRELERIGRMLPGFESVDVRPATLSVVFRYSLEDTDPVTFRSALERQADLTSASSPCAATGWPRPLGAELAFYARRAWLEADRRVSEATRGRLDLRSSMPWILVAVALRQIALSEKLPALPWYTAFYYGLQALLRYCEEDGTGAKLVGAGADPEAPADIA